MSGRKFRIGLAVVLFVVVSGCAAAPHSAAPPPGTASPSPQDGWSVDIQNQLADFDSGSLTYQITHNDTVFNNAHQMSYGDDAVLTVQLRDIGKTPSSGSGTPNPGWQAWSGDVTTNATVSMTHECANITCSNDDPAPASVVPGHIGVFTWDLKASGVGDATITLKPHTYRDPAQASVNSGEVQISVHIKRNTRYASHLAIQALPYIGTGGFGAVALFLRKRITAWWRRRRSTQPPSREPVSADDAGTHAAGSAVSTAIAPVSQESATIQESPQDPA